MFQILKPMNMLQNNCENCLNFGESKKPKQKMETSFKTVAQKYAH